MEAQSQIVKAITEEPIVFEVTPVRTGIKKLLVRLKLMKAARRFTIYPATAGMIEQMAEYSNRINVPEVEMVGDAMNVFSKSSKDVYMYIAISILRDNTGPVAKFKVERLAKWLKGNLSAKATTSLMEVVIKSTDIAFFLSIMNSIAPKTKAKKEKENLGELMNPLGAQPEQ